MVIRKWKMRMRRFSIAAPIENLLFRLFVLVLAVSASRAQEPSSWHDPSRHKVQFVTVEDGVRLEVLDWGGTGRPVVLLADRKSGVEGKSVDLGGRRIIKKKKTNKAGAGCTVEKLKVTQSLVPIALESGIGSVRQSRGRFHPTVASDEESGFFFSSRRRHTRCLSDWSSDVCSSD